MYTSNKKRRKKYFSERIFFLKNQQRLEIYPGKQKKGEWLCNSESNLESTRSLKIKGLKYRQKAAN